MSDQVKIQCQDVERNDGAFYIFKWKEDNQKDPILPYIW
jgi:hypothetical protein